MTYFAKLIFCSVLLVFSCNSKLERPEIKFIECLNSEKYNLGTAIENAIFNFEIHLVTNGVMTDNSGKSYIKLLHKIVNRNTQDIKQSFSESMLEINFNISGCGKSLNNGNEKIKMVLKIMTTIYNDPTVDISKITKDFIQVVNETDFNFTFYKLVAIFLLEYQRFH